MVRIRDAGLQVWRCDKEITELDIGILEWMVIVLIKSQSFIAYLCIKAYLVLQLSKEAL